MPKIITYNFSKLLWKVIFYSFYFTCLCLTPWIQVCIIMNDDDDDDDDFFTLQESLHVRCVARNLRCRSAECVSCPTTTWSAAWWGQWLDVARWRTRCPPAPATSATVQSFPARQRPRRRRRRRRPSVAWTAASLCVPTVRRRTAGRRLLPPTRSTTRISSPPFSRTRTPWVVWNIGTRRSPTTAATVSDVSVCCVRSTARSLVSHITSTTSSTSTLPSTGRHWLRRRHDGFLL